VLSLTWPCTPHYCAIYNTALEDSDMALLREHVFTADLLEGEEERQRARLSKKQGVGRLVDARLPEGCLGMLEHRGIASITVTGAEAVSHSVLSLFFVFTVAQIVCAQSCVLPVSVELVAVLFVLQWYLSKPIYCQFCGAINSAVYAQPQQWLTLNAWCD
jgi:hypothetical protein